MSKTDYIIDISKSRMKHRRTLKGYNIDRRRSLVVVTDNTEEEMPVILYMAPGKTTGELIKANVENNLISFRVNAAQTNTPGLAHIFIYYNGFYDDMYIRINHISDIKLKYGTQ